MGELVNRPGVLPLSEHVDYWDYLGWHDPFARPEHSNRQRAYAKQLGLRYVYTPQIVVDGVAQASGADRSTVHDLLNAAALRPQTPIGIAAPKPGEFVVTLPASATSVTADLWLIHFDRRRTTSIAAGENGGRQIESYNVVRSFEQLATWTGQPLAVTVTPPPPQDSSARAVLLQEPGSGAILGAAVLDAPQH